MTYPPSFINIARSIGAMTVVTVVVTVIVAGTIIRILIRVVIGTPSRIAVALPMPPLSSLVIFLMTWTSVVVLVLDLKCPVSSLLNNPRECYEKQGVQDAAATLYRLAEEL